MSEKYFLVKMDESCLMTSMGWCVCGYGSDLKKCDGELNDKPEWCPLVPVRPIEDVPKFWVELGDEE